MIQTLSLTQTESQKQDRCFYFWPTAPDSTGPDRRKYQSTATDSPWPEARHIRSSESSLTMLRQGPLEDLKDNAYKWYFSGSSCASLQLVVSTDDSHSSVADDVQKTTALLYSWEHNGHGKLASFYAVYFVEQSFRMRAYEQVNRLLSEINVSHLTEWSMIALLRSSFSARACLPAWPKLLSSARNALIHQGKNPDRYLRGLNR